MVTERVWALKEIIGTLCLCEINLEVSGWQDECFELKTFSWILSRSILLSLVKEHLVWEVAPCYDQILDFNFGKLVILPWLISGTAVFLDLVTREFVFIHIIVFKKHDFFIRLLAYNPYPADFTLSDTGPVASIYLHRLPVLSLLFLMKETWICHVDIRHHYSLRVAMDWCRLRVAAYGLSSLEIEVFAEEKSDAQWA